MLSFPQSADPEKEPDYSRIPHIERLCSYLADGSRKSKEASTTIFLHSCLTSIAGRDGP